MLAFTLVVFGLALWLGLYLLQRDWHSPRLRLAGLAGLSYALGWAGTLLDHYAPTATAAIAPLSWPLFWFSPLLWGGVLVYLLPHNHRYRPSLAKLWVYGLLPLAALGYFLVLLTQVLFVPSTLTPASGLGLVGASIAVLLPLLTTSILFWQAAPGVHPKPAARLLLAAVALLILGMALLLVWPDRLTQQWLLLLIGLSFFAGGLALVALEAAFQGEAWLPDVLRSLDFSASAVVLFCGPLVLVILLGTGLSFPMLVLLLTSIATATAVPIFSAQVEALADRIALASFPQLRKARADLRTTAQVLPRLNQALDLEALDNVEFTRLTRRALSQYGDLAHLAGSPLTHLPLVEARLAKRGVTADALERAVELKALLTESISRLKPVGKGDFGTSDEWRYFNALYYPYIVGLKPYSRRSQHPILDPLAKEAWEWFRTQVPERTLHHWQTTAAALIAQDLKKPPKPEVSPTHS